MSYTPPNPNGQATMANSSPVVIASDQSAVAISNAALTALNGAIAGTEVQVDIVGPLPAGTNNIGDVDIVSGTITTVSTVTSVTQNADVRQATASNLNAQVVGNIAHDSVASGNPVQIGGYASAAAPTSVSASGDVVRAWYLLNGAQATVVTAAGALIGGDATNGLDVDVTRVIPGTTATALGKAEDAAHASGDTGVMALAVRTDTAAASSGTTGDYEPLHTDSVGALWTRDTATQVDDAAFTPATGRIMPVGYLADETSTDSVDEGDAGIPRMTLDRKQIVTPYAHTAGGATPYKLNSAASTNATSLKASAGQVYNIMCTNTNAAARYLKLYNKASSPTVGTDTPVQVYAIPGNTAGAGFTISFPVGLIFTTGIAFATTTGAADSDTGAVAANEIVINIAYA